jgi:hypothetical protein
MSRASRSDVYQKSRCMSLPRPAMGETDSEWRDEA